MSPAPQSFESAPAPDSLHVRNGFVLVAALLGIVLIGGLAAGVLFATTEATRVGAAGIGRERALIAGESAVISVITDDGIQLPSSIGVAGTTSYRIDAEAWRVVVHATRLDSAMYWIVADAEGLSSTTGARKRIGVFVRTTNRDDRARVLDPISELAWAELF